MISKDALHSDKFPLPCTLYTWLVGDLLIQINSKLWIYTGPTKTMTQAETKSRDMSKIETHSGNATTLIILIDQCTVFTWLAEKPPPQPSSWPSSSSPPPSSPSSSSSSWSLSPMLSHCFDLTCRSCQFLNNFHHSGSSEPNRLSSSSSSLALLSMRSSFPISYLSSSSRSTAV